jgi:hypothetical protein
VTVNPKMPDPWGPPSVVSLEVTEATIREVLSRLDGLCAQLTEYAAFEIKQAATSTEDLRTMTAIAHLSDAAMGALAAWDRWLTVQNAPETEGPAPAPAGDKVIDLMDALERSVAGAKAARRLTPDQEDAAARHLRLQGGGDTDG